MADPSGNDGTGAPGQSTSSETLRELIERTFLLGVGAAALSKDRIQDLVEEFVRRGQLSGDEGREMVDRLVARSREEARAAVQKADSSFQGVLREIGVVSRKDFEDVEFRLRQLEHRLQLLEAAADAKNPGGPSS